MNDSSVSAPGVEPKLEEMEFSAMRSQGAGGQNVNKVSSAIQLRFDIRASSLPEDCKQRLLARSDRRISEDGVIVIKAQQFRSQERNRAAALERLRALVRSAAVAPAVRRATRIPRAVRRQRTDEKVRRGLLKALRSSAED